MLAQRSTRKKSREGVQQSGWRVRQRRLVLRRRLLRLRRHLLLSLLRRQTWRRGESENFKKPKASKTKSVVVAPKFQPSSFPSTPTSTSSSVSIRVPSRSEPLPPSSGSVSEENLSSSSCEPSPKRSRTLAYELKKQLLRHHEATTKILSLLELPAGIVSTEQVADMYDKASRKFESRVRSCSPSRSTNSSHRSRSPIPSSSRRRSPSPSTSRSGSVKDRLGVSPNISGSSSARVAGNSSSSSRMYSVANPPPQSNFRCVDYRYSRGEVGGYTERADTTDGTPSKSSDEGRGKGSKRQRKGKGKGRKTDDRKKSDISNASTI